MIVMTLVGVVVVAVMAVLFVLLTAGRYCAVLQGILWGQEH